MINKQRSRCYFYQKRRSSTNIITACIVISIPHCACGDWNTITMLPWRYSCHGLSLQISAFVESLQCVQIIQSTHSSTISLSCDRAFNPDYFCILPWSFKELCKFNCASRICSNVLLQKDKVSTSSLIQQWNPKSCGVYSYNSWWWSEQSSSRSWRARSPSTASSTSGDFLSVHKAGTAPPNKRPCRPSGPDAIAAIAPAAAHCQQSLVRSGNCTSHRRSCFPTSSPQDRRDFDHDIRLHSIKHEAGSSHESCAAFWSERLTACMLSARRSSKSASVDKNSQCDEDRGCSTKQRISSQARSTWWSVKWDIDPRVLEWCLRKNPGKMWMRSHGAAFANVKPRQSQDIGRWMRARHDSCDKITYGRAILFLECLQALCRTWPCSAASAIAAQVSGKMEQHAAKSQKASKHSNQTNAAFHRAVYSCDIKKSKAAQSCSVQRASYGELGSTKLWCLKHMPQEERYHRDVMTERAK